MEEQADMYWSQSNVESANASEAQDPVAAGPALSQSPLARAAIRHVMPPAFAAMVA
jgi:hypothetical protein